MSRRCQENKISEFIKLSSTEASTLVMPHALIKQLTDNYKHVYEGALERRKSNKMGRTGKDEENTKCISPGTY